MIDCHVHTARCHHGEGELGDYVAAAIRLGIDTLCFLEHAPFAYDHDKRLTVAEVWQYLEDVERLRERYHDTLLILAGLEVDCAPSARKQTEQICKMFGSCDVIACGVHFIELESEVIPIWDYGKARRPEVYRAYFEAMKDAAKSGMFDVVVHPDAILRTGACMAPLQRSFDMLCATLSESNVAYEVNCAPIPPTPVLSLALSAAQQGVALTIGSDAHRPAELSRNVATAARMLKANGVESICYFEQRQKRHYELP